MVNICFLCRQNAESMNHLFNECETALKVYRQVTCRFSQVPQLYNVIQLSIDVHRFILTSSIEAKDKEILAIIIFII
jgi:hypothetical protein